MKFLDKLSDATPQLSAEEREAMLRAYRAILLDGIAADGLPEGLPDHQLANLETLAANLGFDAARVRRDAQVLAELTRLAALSDQCAERDAAHLAAAERLREFDAETNAISAERIHQRQEVAKALRNCGSELFEAEKAARALRELRAQYPDLVDASTNETHLGESDSTPAGDAPGAGE